MQKYIIPAIAVLALLAACGPQYQVEEKDGYNLIIQKGGPAMSLSPFSMRTIQLPKPGLKASPGATLWRSSRTGPTGARP